MFFLPDRQTNLDLVDDVAARGECLVPMRRRNAYPNGALADLEHAVTMHALGMQDRKLLECLLDDLFPFFDCKGLVDLVLETMHVLAFVVIPDPALERRVPAGTVAVLTIPPVTSDSRVATPALRKTPTTSLSGNA